MKSKPIKGVKSTKNLGMKYSSYLDEKDFNEMILEKRTEEEYLEDYCMIVDYALKRGLKKNEVNFYTEKHHILPRCMSGENEDYNYVLLSALEHIVAHILLYRLYPSNSKIVFSAFLMTAVNSNYTVERKDYLNNIDICLLANIREEFQKSLSNIRSIPIVCCDKLGNIIKIYSSMSEANNYGFRNKSISKSIKTGNFHYGYKFTKLDDFIKQKENREKLEFFDNNIDTKQISICSNKKKVVCLDNDYSIVKIFESISSLTKSNFSLKIVGDYCRNKLLKHHKGYLWMFLDDYIEKYPEKYKSSDKVTLENVNITPRKNPPTLYKTRSVVQCNLADHSIIYHIYSSITEAESHGFNISNISSICKKKGNRVANGGYHWIFLEEYQILYPTELDKYLKNYDNSNIYYPIKEEEYFPLACIHNSDIIKIFNNLDELIVDKLSYYRVKQSIFNNTYYYGYSWKKLNDINIKDYNILENSTVLSNSSVICHDDKFNILKIYDKITDINKDGFYNNNLAKVRNDNPTQVTVKYCGYYWTPKDLWKNKEKLDAYYSSKNRGSINNSTTKIICLSKNKDIIKIYNSSKEVVSDGFNNKVLLRKLKNNEKEIFYKGYYWVKYDSWRNKENVINFENKQSASPILITKEFDTVLKATVNHDIIIIYKTLKEAREVGKYYGKESLGDYTSTGKKRKSGILWFKFSDFKEKYPDKLEEYYKQQEQK